MLINGPVPIGNVTITPVYANTFKQMEAVIQTSRECQQYLEVESKGSRVF